MATNQENRNVERFQIALSQGYQSETMDQAVADISETSPRYFYKGGLCDVQHFAAELLKRSRKDEIKFIYALIWSLDRKLISLVGMVETCGAVWFSSDDSDILWLISEGVRVYETDEFYEDD